MEGSRPKIKIIGAIVMFSIIIAVLYLSIKLRSDEAEEILANPIVVTGTVTHVGWKTIDVSYKIEGKTYTYTESTPFKSVEIGEEFYTLVNSKNFNSALVYDNKPILDTVEYSFATTTPTSVSEPVTDDDYLDFEYTVNGQKYNRIQKYYGDVPIPKNLKVLKVKYRVDRPEIGYLVE